MARTSTILPPAASETTMKKEIEKGMPVGSDDLFSVARKCGDLVVEGHPDDEDMWVPIEMAERILKERNDAKTRLDEIINGLHEIKHYAHMNGGSLIGLKIFHLIYPENSQAHGRDCISPTGYMAFAQGDGLEWSKDCFVKVEEKTEMSLEKQIEKARSLINKPCYRKSNGTELPFIPDHVAVFYKAEQPASICCREYLDNNDFCVAVAALNGNYPVMWVEDKPVRVTVPLNDSEIVEDNNEPEQDNYKELVDDLILQFHGWQTREEGIVYSESKTRLHRKAMEISLKRQLERVTKDG